MEVVPLTLLTLNVWDFIQLTRSRYDTCGIEISIPHKWTFHLRMAVGFWNFVGAGGFGFLINLPIVSYFEAGTILTPNHGHTAMMGVFGMMAMALMVATSLFPGGVLQLLDVLKNGHWHARGPEFSGQRIVRIIEWLRMPGDLVFIGLGVIPAAAGFFSKISIDSQNSCRYSTPQKTNFLYEIKNVQKLEV